MKIKQVFNAAPTAIESEFLLLGDSPCVEKFQTFVEQFNYDDLVCFPLNSIFNSFVIVLFVFID